MSEGRKPLSRWVLVGELVACIAFGAAVAAYGLSVPPSVNLGMSLPMAVGSRMLFFAAIMGLFNFAQYEGKAGRRILGLILLACAILMLPILLVFSFPQY
jgi:hypothetical protein